MLRRRVSGAVKRNFRPSNRRFTSQNDKFEWSIPILKHLFIFSVGKKMYCLHKATRAVSCVKQMSANEKRRYVMTSDFRQYMAENILRKFLTLSNQMSRYILKCIRNCIIDIYVLNANNEDPAPFVNYLVGGLQTIIGKNI